MLLEQAGHRQDEDQKKMGGAAVFSPELEIFEIKETAQAIDQEERKKKLIKVMGKEGGGWL